MAFRDHPVMGAVLGDNVGSVEGIMKSIWMVQEKWYDGDWVEFEWYKTRALARRAIKNIKYANGKFSCSGKFRIKHYAEKI
jgi:beta-glucanase (GH16 family)